MSEKKQPYTESEHEHTVANRLAGKDIVRRAAIRGNSICGASTAMDATAQSLGLETPIDYADEDDGGEW